MKVPVSFRNMPDAEIHVASCTMHGTTLDNALLAVVIETCWVSC